MLDKYIKTEWLDHIVDITNGEVIQNGTRFTAKRANNIEDGIYNAYLNLEEIRTSMKKLQVQLELDGRVPGNSGSFIDTFDGSATRIELLTSNADIVSSVTEGELVEIPVSNVAGFEPMTYVTIYDGVNYEHVLVGTVNENSITVQTLANNYNKGAKVARSTTAPNTLTKTLEVAPFVTYNVEFVEII